MWFKTHMQMIFNKLHVSMIEWGMMCRSNRECYKSTAPFAHISNNARKHSEGNKNVTVKSVWHLCSSLKNKILNLQ